MKNTQRGRIFVATLKALMERGEVSALIISRLMDIHPGVVYNWLKGKAVPRQTRTLQRIEAVIQQLAEAIRNGALPVQGEFRTKRDRRLAIERVLGIEHPEEERVDETMTQPAFYDARTMELVQGVLEGQDSERAGE